MYVETGISSGGCSMPMMIHRMLTDYGGFIEETTVKRISCLKKFLGIDSSKRQSVLDLLLAGQR